MHSTGISFAAEILEVDKKGILVKVVRNFEIFAQNHMNLALEHEISRIARMVPEKILTISIGSKWGNIEFSDDLNFLYK